MSSNSTELPANTTQSDIEKDHDWSEEAEEDIESSLDSGVTVEPSNLTLPSTKKRSRRELMKMSSIELDVATPQLLIVDRDENIYGSQACISKTLIPLFPISFLTVVLLTGTISVSCYKHWFVPQKTLLFY